MRKFAVVSTFFLFTVSLAFSQYGSAYKQVRFGFQLSPTFSWMSSSDNSINSSGTALGLKLGMIGEFYFQEDRYAVTTGLGFAFNTGGKLVYEEGGRYWTESGISDNLVFFPDNVKLQYQLQYVEIPVGLKLKTPLGGSPDYNYYVEPFLLLGFNTQAKGTATGSGLGDELSEIDIREEIFDIYAAWGVGTGVEYAISDNTHLIGGLGIQIGFSDVTDDDGVVIPDPNDPTVTMDEDSKGTASSFIIRLGILF